MRWSLAGQAKPLNLVYTTELAEPEFWTSHMESRDMIAFGSPFGLLRISALPQGATNAMAQSISPRVDYNLAGNALLRRSPFEV